ncbi:class C sortase [Leucobacter salsicius]|uniref:class C sortase n=1 Tax=Leucobacter salsicius TaxID=664638 RepID=UPI0003473CB2|nr:class C sortase [Leucobacter salsicius]
MLGIGLLVYPAGADWVNSIGHNSEISGYIRGVESTAGPERQRILDAAYAYNDYLEPGPLTDPYISMNEDAVMRSELYAAYEEMLRVSGSDAIGTLSYPEIEVALPVYHGTENAVISKGVGHMYGTSLPVGGPSTRSVLTAHSGLPQAKLFTPLHDAKVGDNFWISVLGEDHHYEVREIETVLPNETDSFEITEGEDWVTLFTCTPTGVNSHRLLVHAERISGPESDGREVIAGDGVELGFPWWAVWFIGGSAAVGWLLFSKPRTRPRKSHTIDKST